MTSPGMTRYDPCAILLTQILLCIFLHGLTTSTSADKDCYSSPSAEEKVWLSNFCTQEALTYNRTIFAYPGNITNYLMCTDVQTGCPGVCPPWHLFEPLTMKCYLQPTTTPRFNFCSLPPGTNVSAAEKPWPRIYNNPCKHMPDGKCYYLKNRLSRASYIMCVPFNWPTYRFCMRGLIWEQNNLSCEPPNVQAVSCIPGSVNQCRQLIGQTHSPEPAYFPCKGNGTYFMKCSREGDMLITKCLPGKVWVQSEYQCRNSF